MAFGKQEKEPKPAEGRKCPFVHLGGSSAMGCLKGNCTIWHDEANECAINLIAKAVQRDG